MKRKIFSVLFALALVFSFSLMMALPAMAATTYYVATTGNDTTGDGSSGNPWATISHAITQVSAGDTINVGPGTYHETHEHGPGGGVAVEVPWFAEGAGGLTIQSSDGPENTIIDCDMGGTDGWAASGVKIVSNNIIFTGFTVKNAYTAVGQVSAKNHTLSNLIITDFVEVGLELMAVHNCTFSNITIHTNDVSESENRTVKGIDMQEYGSGGNTNNTFQDVTIYNIETTGESGSSMGIYWEGDDPENHPTTNNTFTNVTIYDMVGPWIGTGIYMYGQDASLPAIVDTTFSGGSIYNCSSTGIYVLGGCKNLSISQFDITNNGGHGIGIRHYYGTACENIDINENNIVGHTSADCYGVKDYEGDNDVDAENNWWGSASGPTHASNTYTVPAGTPQGDAVSDNVDYVPWLDGPFATGTSFAPVTSEDGEFSSIQAAIDAAGGTTITCAAGTYTITSTINVNKEVTITGDTGTPANVIVQYSPADITQTIFEITASNVTIEGIKTISGRYAVAFNTGNPTGCTISHCILDQPGRRGINFWTGSGTGHTVEYTTISNVGPSADANPGDEVGIMIYKPGALNLTIQHNTFTNMYRGIWLFGGNSIVIDNNTFTSIKDQGHDGDVYHGAPAIDLHNSAATGTGNRVEVTNNTISDCYWQGILVVKCPYTYVHNNAVSHCNYYGIDGDGDWDYAAIHVQDYPNYGDTKSDHCIIDGNTVFDSINGIQIWSDNCQVTNNEIYNMGLTYADTRVVGDRTYKNSAILVGTNFGNPAIEHDPTGVVIEYNNIHDNYWGLFYSADLTNGVTAEHNWWGHATGPHHATSNPGGTGDEVSDNVNYCPWLGASYATTPRTYHVNETCTIQSAIDEASAGDTINVAAGTYAEQLTINKSLTLQAGSTPIIDCSDRSALGLAKTDGCVEVTADNVTIQGFKLIGYDPTGESWADQKSSSNYATIKVTNEADGLKVKDNEFTGTSKAAVGLLIDDDCDDVEFTGNTVTDYLQGVVGHKNVDNLLVQGNTFTIPIAENTGLAHDESYGYGVQLWHGNNLQVIDNTFTGSWNTATGDYEDPDSLCNHYAVSTFTTYFASAFTWPDIVGDMYIEDNEMTNLYLGIGSFAGGGTVEDNNIHDNELGLQLGQVSGTWATAPTAGLAITGNEFCTNTRGIWVQSFEVDGIAAHFNNIVGNTEYGVINEDPENDVFDAMYNYWGGVSGPKQVTTNPRGEGDEVSTNVDYQQWLTREFQTVLDNNIAYFGYAWANLSAGWNILSTPIALDPECDQWDEYVALGNPDLNIHATSPAYAFDPTATPPWVPLTGDNADYLLEPCDAIYVRMAQADIAPILYSPNTSVPSKDLYPGWNLVGLANTDATMSARDALTSVYKVAGDLTGYSQVVSPSMGNQTAWIYIRDGTDHDMQRTKGYWVFMVNAPTGTTLAGFTFTPQSLPD